jgi:hypothetical protein
LPLRQNGFLLRSREKLRAKCSKDAKGRTLKTMEIRSAAIETGDGRGLFYQICNLFRFERKKRNRRGDVSPTPLPAAGTQSPRRIGMSFEKTNWTAGDCGMAAKAAYVATSFGGFA